MRKQLSAGPYLIWMIGFTVIPLIMIVYYGLTDASGAFTLNNMLAIMEPQRMSALLRSLKLSLLCTVICLLLSAQVKIIVHTLNCVCILTAAHIECRLSQKIAVLKRNDFVCVIFSYFVIDFRANILSSA